MVKVCGNDEGTGGWEPGPCILPADHVEHFDGRVRWRSPDAAELVTLGWLSPERVAELRALADRGWPETTYEAESLGVMMLWLLDGGTYDAATGEVRPAG